MPVPVLIKVDLSCLVITKRQKKILEIITNSGFRAASTRDVFKDATPIPEEEMEFFLCEEEDLNWFSITMKKLLRNDIERIARFVIETHKDFLTSKPVINIFLNDKFEFMQTDVTQVAKDIADSGVLGFDTININITYVKGGD